jgi:DNA-binding response OmpR family regulator
VLEQYIDRSQFDVEKAKRIGQAVEIASNIPSPIMPVLKVVNYAVKGITAVGQIRQAKQEAYDKQVAMMKAQREAQRQVVGGSDNKIYYYLAGGGILLLATFFLLKRR